MATPDRFLFPADVKKNKQVTGESPPTSSCSAFPALIHFCCFQDTRRRESTWVSPPDPAPTTRNTQLSGGGEGGRGLGVT